MIKAGNWCFKLDPRIRQCGKMSPAAFDFRLLRRRQFPEEVGSLGFHDKVQPFLTILFNKDCPVGIA